MSFEKDIHDEKIHPEKVDISLLKFFWQANSRLSGNEDTIPRFLRNVDVLKNFTDNELRILSRYLHYRTFTEGETIFSQGDAGIGFYFIFSGSVRILFEDELHPEKGSEFKICLERYSCFGELALLQKGSVRSATAQADEPCELIGIFKPDLDEMINQHPVIAARLLQSIGVVVTNRLFNTTREVKNLKYQLGKLQKTEGV